MCNQLGPLPFLHVLLQKSHLAWATNLASIAFTWALGLITPRPHLQTNNVITSHFTFTCVFSAQPPQIKFLTKAFIWSYILRLGFQQSRLYHMKTIITWFATRMHPESDQLFIAVDQLSFERQHDLVKIRLNAHRWKPTWIPKYFTPQHSKIQTRPTTWPHSQSLGCLDAHIAEYFHQLTFAPTTKQSRERTLLALSRLSMVPSYLSWLSRSYHLHTTSPWAPCHLALWACVCHEPDCSTCNPTRRLPEWTNLTRGDTLAEQIWKDERAPLPPPLTWIDEVTNLYSVDVNRIQRSLEPKVRKA